MGKGHPKLSVTRPAKVAGDGGKGLPRTGSSHFLGVAPAPGPGKVRRLGEAEAVWPACAAGVALSSGRDLLSPPGSEGGAQEGSGSALARAVAFLQAWGAEGLPRGGTHRHGGAPGRREQEAGRWKGLSGRAQQRGNPAAAAPLGRPPPLLRPFPSPALPRPLPSAHKTFFFFQTSWEDPGGPMGGGEAGTNSGGGRGRTNGSAGRAGGGACRDGTGARGRSGPADGGGGSRGPGSGRLRVGRKEGPSVQVTRSGPGAGVQGRGSRVWHPVALLWLPRAAGRSDGSTEGSAPGCDGVVGNAPSTSNSAAATRQAPLLTCVA